MRTYTLFITLLIVAMTGCNKNDTPTAYYGPDHGDLVFTVTGVHDVIMEQSDSTNLQLKITRSEGRFEDVTLSVTEAPKGITVIYTPGVAQPSFNAVMTIVTTRVAPGDYPIHVSAFSQTAGTHYYDMIIHVNPYSNAATGLVGKFLETGNCSINNTISNTVYIEAAKDQNNKVLMTGIWTGGLTYDVYALIDPKTGSLTIPTQTVNKVDFSGTGSYTDTSASISYMVKGSSFTDNCTVQLQRQ